MGMKKRMVWMWPTMIEGTDEKGRPTKIQLLVLEPQPEVKPQKVALYTNVMKDNS
jgi:hypothetical protein